MIVITFVVLQVIGHIYLIFLILNSLIEALNLFKHEKLFGESKKSEIILQSKQFTIKRHMQCKLWIVIAIILTA